MRKTEFAIGEYYHIYNRGVDKRTIFECEKDYERFLLGVKEFNDNSTREQRLLSKWKQKTELSSDISELSSVFCADLSKLVEIICYCLNSNHYHFILKQLEEDGIKVFMHKIGTGYTNYFNKQYDRSGSLFQGPFKSIHINSNEYLLLLSAYVNANHQIHGYQEKDWSYSSLLDYTGKRSRGLCSREIIEGEFNNDFIGYEKYLEDNISYFRERKEMEKYILE